jgi:hypothetical protein
MLSPTVWGFRARFVFFRAAMYSHYTQIAHSHARAAHETRTTFVQLSLRTAIV